MNHGGRESIEIFRLDGRGADLGARWLGIPACRAPWVVAAIDPETSEVRTMVAHSGDRLGAVATAERGGDRIYSSAVFGDRIGAWTPRTRGGR